MLYLQEEYVLQRPVKMGLKIAADERKKNMLRSFKKTNWIARA